MVKRRGASPAVAVAMMTGLLLVTILIALYYSISLIDSNRQAMEYQHAKDQLIYAAMAFEQVASGMGEARYVRFSLSSVRLNVFLGPILELNLSGGGVVHTIRVRSARIEVCGGPLATTVPRLLYPEGKSLDERERLIVEAGEAAAVVHEHFSRAACAVLETGRVRVYYYGSLGTHDYYLVTVVNVNLGVLGGSETVPLIFRTANFTTMTFRYDVCSVNLIASYAGTNKEVRLWCIPNTNTRGIVVVVKVVGVKVSMG